MVGLMLMIFLTSALPLQSAGPLSKQQLLDLHKAGIGDSVVIDAISRQGISFDPSSEVLVELKAAGFSDEVLKALLSRISVETLSPAHQKPANPTPPIPEKSDSSILGSWSCAIRSKKGDSSGELLINVTDIKEGKPTGNYSAQAHVTLEDYVNASIQTSGRVQFDVDDKDPSLVFFLPKRTAAIACTGTGCNEETFATDDERELYSPDTEIMWMRLRLAGDRLLPAEEKVEKSYDVSCKRGGERSYGRIDTKTSSIPEQQPYCALAFARAQAVGTPRLYDSTGNPQLDAVILRELTVLGTGFLVHPRFFLFDDTGSPNAMATPVRIDSSPSFPDGTLLFGVTLFAQEFSRQSGQGFAIPAIMAHEFGHIVQFKLGVGMPTHLLELHADFLAGWYLGNRRNFIYTEVQEPLESFFEKGDYMFNNPGHHGTPKERLAAVAAGLASASLPIGEAVKRGLGYVNTP